VVVRSELLRPALGPDSPLLDPLDPSVLLLLGRGGWGRHPPSGEVIGASTLREGGLLQLCRLLRWPHFCPAQWCACARPLLRLGCLHCPVRRHQLLAPPCSPASASCTSPLLGVSLLHFPAPRRQPLALPRSLASGSYCDDHQSVLISATRSAPSPQSGFTGNEVWRGLRIRRLSPWTGRTVLDAPTTHRSFRP
jgi:hypothetical protein